MIPKKRLPSKPPKFRKQETSGKIVTSDSNGAVKYMINPEVMEQLHSKTHRSNENLVPNQAIDVAAKDPAFDLRQSQCHLPKDKQAIRAAILQDVEELERLYSDVTHLPHLLCKSRSVDVPLTAMHYALRAGLPDIKPTFDSSLSLASDIAYFACSVGLSPELLQLLVDIYPKTKDVDMKEMLCNNMYRALEMGHVDTAQFLIRTSRQKTTAYTVIGHASAINPPGVHGLTELHESGLHTEEPLSSAFTQLIAAAKECLNTTDGRNRHPIHYAAACSSTKPLEFLINKVSIEEQDVNGMTPVMIAAGAGREKNVDLLLKTASKSNFLHVVNVAERPDRNNRSAVHYAAMNGHAFGALIEIRDELQRTALIHAAMNGHYPVITYLLHKGADPNVADSSNNSAIHYAAAYGWYHCVLVLLQASANPDVYNDRKMPPIGVTLLKDHRETAHLLAEHHADANFRDERGRTILARLLAEEPLTRGLFDRYLQARHECSGCTRHGTAANSVRVGENREVDSIRQSVSICLAKMLLDRGAELNMAGYSGRLPLYFAVDDMNVALVELFVRRGAHCPRSTNLSAHNVLHMLARSWDQGNMADIVFGLVNKIVGKTRRNYRNPNDEGKSAAHYLSKSAIDKECKVLACLLRHKPKLDLLDSQGASPLITALLNRNGRAEQMLLDAGAQPNFCSNNPKHKYPIAPLTLAVARHGPGDQACFRLSELFFKQYQTSNSCHRIPGMEELRSCLRLKREKASTKFSFIEIDLVNALLEEQASLKECDAQGRTPLHLAVNASGPSSALFDIPDLLMEKGASLTVADKFGRVPLHYAYVKIGKSG
ncbi:uncharacterized protein LOC143448524 [Clavelina lepadiformis]|uniref:uncharacterized protein LOC143448524 n=1 Tax=Clavelina lepadiformis TaxID=159417 RepID=UPI0040434859